MEEDSLRIAAIGCMLSFAACGTTGAPATAPVPTNATRAVYEAVAAHALRTDHLCVAQTTLPLPAAWAGKSFTRGEPAGTDLRALGLRLPFDAAWVAVPSMASDSARAAYFERLRPVAEVTVFSEIWWNADRTSAVLAVSRIRCARCGNGSSVLRLERRGAGWVVQPGGLTVRE